MAALRLSFALGLAAGRTAPRRKKRSWKPSVGITHLSKCAVHCAACKLRTFVARQPAKLAWQCYVDSRTVRLARGACGRTGLTGPLGTVSVEPLHGTTE